MNTSSYNSDILPICKSDNGLWIPKTKKEKFPPMRKRIPKKDIELEQYHLEVKHNRNIAYYIRPQKSNAQYPPILVSNPGLGYGDKIVAGTISKYINGFNPIIADTRDSGNSTPKNTYSDNRNKDGKSIYKYDLLSLQEKTGYKEMSYMGGSFGGTISISAAAEALRQGYKIPFFAVSAPTICQGDIEIEWMFKKVPYEGPAEYTDCLSKAHNNLLQLADDKNPINIVKMYDLLLNDNDDKSSFLEALVRMRNYERGLFNVKPISKEDVINILSNGTNRSCDFVLEKIINNTLDIDRDIEEIDFHDNQQKKKRSEFLSLYRYINYIKVWVNSWIDNHGFSKDEILNDIICLQENNVSGLILIDKYDPYLPTKQFDDLNKLISPNGSIKLEITEERTHNLRGEKAKDIFFRYLEKMRWELYCNPEIVKERYENNKKRKMNIYKKISVGSAMEKLVLKR